KPAPIAVPLDSIPTYNGDSDVREFLAYIQDAMELSGWSEAFAVRIAKLKLRGAAKKTLDANSTPGEALTWAQLSKLLKDRFEKTTLPNELYLQFKALRQRADEDAIQFSERIRIFANKTWKRSGNAAQDEAVKRRVQEESLLQFITGILPSLQRVVFNRDPTTLEEAVKIASREMKIDKCLKKTGNTYHR